MQIDRLCNCGSQVIDVESLWNSWHLKNRAFQFFWYWKGQEILTSSLSNVFCKKDVLKNFVNCTGVFLWIL